MEKKKVSVIKCSSYDNKEVRRVLENSLKNINFKFKPKMKVLIKPNILLPIKPKKAITTHPAIIEELCKILKEYKIKIYIGESSSYNTNLGFEISGIKQLSKYAHIINFEKEQKRFFDFGKKIKEIPFPKIIFDVDLIINIAKMKTHGLTKVTLCVKNLYGCIPGKMKKIGHKMMPTPKRFSKFLLKIESIIKPSLNIIDGIEGLEGNGPGTSGKPIKSKILVASKNACAADIVASKIMGFKPKSIYTNRFSEVKEKDIEVVGNGKDIKLKFKKPNFLNSENMLITYFSKFIPKPKIKFKLEKCKKCKICEKKCPVKAIEFNTWPKINHKKCILCLCCVEVCPNNTIYLEEYWLKSVLKNLIRKILKY